MILQTRHSMLLPTRHNAYGDRGGAAACQLPVAATACGQRGTVLLLLLLQQSGRCSLMH
jgi:hypothetical protein